jgi:hypothetical protein
MATNQPTGLWTKWQLLVGVDCFRIADLTFPNPRRPAREFAFLRRAPNLRYLLLIAQRRAAAKTEFAVFRKMA